MSFDFKGKTVIVTGAASGIGFQIARSFLEAGANVSLWDYSAEALNKAKDQLASHGARAQALSVDVSKRDSIAAAAQALTAPVDVVVNNAGITRDKSFAKLTPEDWDAVISVNLTGLYNVVKGLFEKFNPASNHKRIVNISSVVGVYGNFGQANYSAAKAGVIGFTKTMGKELGRKGFTVNAIAPGFISTPMTAAMPPEALQAMAAKVPVQRLGETADIANAVMFLASEQSSYVNGAVLHVDGGVIF